MTCNLRKNGLYTLSRVTYNTESGLYTTYLSNPPSTCSDGVLTSHKATVSVVPGIPSPTLAYDDTAHRPIITVANSRAIEFVSPPTGSSFFAIFFTLSLAAFAVVLFTAMFRSFTTMGADGTITVGSGRRRRQYRGRYNSTSVPTQSAPQTVVVNQGNNDGLLTGVLLGEALSGHRDHETVVHEREVIHERDTSPAQDTDDSYSSDDSSSSSSDSDSFSSDSGSDSGSFGSDSGSDFGGGSFGND